MTMPLPQTMQFLAEAVAVRENFTDVIKSFAKSDADDRGLGCVRKQIFVWNKVREMQGLRDSFQMAVIAHSVIAACTQTPPKVTPLEILYDLAFTKYDTLN